MRRSLTWALFILAVMTSASLTAGAEARLLGADTPGATISPTPEDIITVCMERGYDHDGCVAMGMAFRSVVATPTVVCAGYDARLPAPDSCPPGTPDPSRR